jgi:hypothetical protein
MPLYLDTSSDETERHTGICRGLSTHGRFREAAAVADRVFRSQLSGEQAVEGDDGDREAEGGNN